MSVYTPLNPTEMSAFFEQFDLGCVTSFEGSEDGIENTNFFVTTSKQKQYVLTIFESLTTEKLPGFIQLMEHLSNADLPVPMPIEDKHKQLIHTIKGKPAMLFPRLKGSHIDSPSVHQCAALGATIAKLHLSTNTFSAKPFTDYTLLWAQTQIPTLLGKELSANRKLNTEDTSLLKDISQLCDRFLERFKHLPSGLIHGDLFRDNVLFSPVQNSNGKAESEEPTGLIDFYHASPAFLIYDLAVAVNDWCVDDNRRLDIARVDAMVAAYEKIRPLEDLEKEAWPQMLIFSAYRFWVSRLLNKLYPGETEDKEDLLLTVKDPEEFKILMKNNRDLI